MSTMPLSGARHAFHKTRGLRRTVLAAIAFGSIAAHADTTDTADKTDPAAAPGLPADCGLSGLTGEVGILANDFVTTNVIADVLAGCEVPDLDIVTNLNTEVRDIQVAALTSDPAAYDAVVTANGSVVPLLNGNLVRPLDELIAAHGGALSERQKISIDGQVMAIAFMANAQHLVYRQDLLDAIDREPPTTWDEVIEAAELLRGRELMRHPIAGTYKVGFNLALEFINHYLALGGDLFVGNTPEPALVNDIGVAALERMKRVTELMAPDFLTMDTKGVVAEMEQGRAAFANLWGSSAGSVIDERGAAENVVEHLRLAAAPLVGEPGRPAATLWWDGFTIARNTDRASAEAAFRALTATTGVEVANAYGDAAVWLAEGYASTPTDAGVLATVEAGAAPYPILPWMSLMNGALGAELVEFFQGGEDARTALADVEASYRTQAQGEGYLDAAR